ncbi:MAG TPA: tetratricopeptide repeat protein [Acidobacteriaceae bacterium]|jgi:tetratricopeptide (TPR) repeat protein|nr:tetratricopeptide repeat protein [Acidobacteriaceae bacterium]
MSITRSMRWIKTTMVAGALAAGALMAVTGPRAVAQGPTGSIHGHVQNAAGVAVTTGDVKLTRDVTPSANSQFKYDFPVDQNGNYKSDGVAEGLYTAVYMQGASPVDLLSKVKITANTDTAADFDMTRKDFIDKMTPEEKQQLADYKAKVAAASTENAKIASLNNALQQARADMESTHANCTTPKPDNVVCPPPPANFDQAASLLQDAVAAKPDQSILWFTLGDAQRGQKKYDDAAVSYNKAVTLNDASKKPNPELDAAAYNNLGQAKAEAGQTEDAVAAFEAAVKAQPSQASMYYFNEAAIFFNKGQNGDAAAFTAALAAADKAIAVDPTQAMPYYIRATALIQNATVDKSGKIIAPPGCAEAYQKYIELAPNGEYAQDATDVLTSLGETIHSSYKAKKN